MMGLHQSKLEIRFGFATASKHQIILNYLFTPPTSFNLYWTRKVKLDLERKQFVEMCEADVLESTTTEWALPIVFVSKMDRCLRFYIDYFCLNAADERRGYSILRMNDCMKAQDVNSASLVFDDDSAYWQIEMGRRYIDKSVFALHRSFPLYECPDWAQEGSCHVSTRNRHFLSPGQVETCHNINWRRYHFQGHLWSCTQTKHNGSSQKP